MTTVRRFPQHNDSNGWWEILPPTLPRQKSGPRRVSTAIVGGGICGVSVANRLGELCPNDEICLIEAHRVGFGASGRNAGFMLNLHSHGPPKNLDIVRRNINFWQTGLDSMRHKVQAWQIQCDWSEAGRFYAAAGPDGEQHLRELGETLEALELEFDWQDSGALASRIGTDFYSQGMFVPGNALVNPAAMMRGFAKHLPTNVTLSEETSVTGFERHGEGFRVFTSGGEIIADRLVLASGVFLKDFGIASGQYVPMATYASLSAPMGPDMLSALGTGEEFGLLASSEVGSTIRLTCDKRLFIRNGVNFEPGASATQAATQNIALLHRRALNARWPALSELRFEFSWGGAMAFTTNSGSVFGEYGKNLFAILTNDVSPMTRGEASGGLLAEFMEGQDSELLALQMSLPEAKRLPPRPFLDAGILLRQKYMSLKCGEEF